jgi:N-acetylmuramoyl-L-alanine amidase
MATLSPVETMQIPPAFAVAKGRLNMAGKPVRFLQSPYAGGSFSRREPSLLVMHYTSGGTALSSANWFRSPANPGSSAHLVIDRDGSIIQCVDLSRIAWHAGASSWKKRSNLNRFSIGIELANWGALRPRGKGWASYTGVGIPSPVLAAHRHGNPDGSRRLIGWEAFPPAQIAAATAVARAILAAMPGIREIVGHDDIAPGRKTDPGPAFDMAAFRTAVMDQR